MAYGFDNIGKVPELQKRLLFTLFMLFVYRIGIHIPTPGIDSAIMAEWFEQQRGTLLGMFDMFAGGGLRSLSIFALGIMPYISASIIVQLLGMVHPTFEQLQKEGAAGRRKLTQYTRYLTVVLCLIQSYFMAFGVEQMSGPAGEPVVLYPGWGFRLTAMITMTTGTCFLMWLGEQITERGIGNGISLIIFAGIVAGLPVAIYNSVRLTSTGELPIFLLLFLVVFMLAVVAGIVFVETAQRRIPIQYPKQIRGRRVYGGQSTHLPLKINVSGVIPPIFASSIIVFPATIAQFFPNIGFMRTLAETMNPGGLLYNVIFVVAIVFFTYFYTAVVFNPVDVSENLKKHGGYVPGIRPGKATAEYLDKVLSRLTLVGAVYLSVVCVLPMILISRANVPFYFGGTSLLIVIGVSLDTMSQIESHLISRQYDGLLKSGRIKSRR
ncbi:MAG: preprotein translocase subunit SecY [Desulfomonilia bacterium]|uniref:Protein translocase subunit SecY n=1 Tax=anaerobic digester metagenome TaxID=1263854 RepID=A0A485LWX4_9ZZZZ|nr:preprotein translocase subunit SecY [Pseudomonadota bacterium]HPD22300.1 preprotein translocase subunit SecY [Deltaproteobacteria bacterium]HPX19311.1 preprotein translocase subunit SecY [Deltaproteobacteria bacterium]HRS57259.1 preprotein translocase subunit SecY [Desulfomonilia bacterium]HRV36684.1 preprotein translocase subunit SecY [Desulfomonilia bacterium]